MRSRPNRRKLAVQRLECRRLLTAELLELSLTARTPAGDFLEPGSDGRIAVEVGQVFDLEVSLDDLRPQGSDNGVYGLVTDLVLSQHEVVTPLLTETQVLTVQSGGELEFTIPELPPGVANGELTSNGVDDGIISPIDFLTALTDFGYAAEDFELDVNDFTDEFDNTVFEATIRWTRDRFANVNLPLISVTTGESHQFSPLLSDGSSNPDAVPFNLDFQSRALGEAFYSPLGALAGSWSSDWNLGQNIVGRLSSGWGEQSDFVDAFRIPVFINQPVDQLEISVQPAANSGFSLYGADNDFGPELIRLDDDATLTFVTIQDDPEDIIELFLRARTSDGTSFLEPDAEGRIHVEVGQPFDLEIALDDFRRFGGDLGVFRLATDLVISQQEAVTPLLTETQYLTVPASGGDLEFSIPFLPPGVTAGELTSNGVEDGVITPSDFFTALTDFGYAAEDFVLNVAEFLDESGETAIAATIRWTRDRFTNVNHPLISVSTGETRQFSPVLPDGSSNPSAVPFNLGLQSYALDAQFYHSEKLFAGSASSAWNLDHDLVGMLNAYGWEHGFSGQGRPVDAFRIPVMINRPIEQLEISVRSSVGEVFVLYGTGPDGEFEPEIGPNQILLDQDARLTFTSSRKDFGDAPDGYPVALRDDGARHLFFEESERTAWLNSGGELLGGEVLGDQQQSLFGLSIALSEDGGTLAVGAPAARFGDASTGAVFLYRQQAGVWQPLGDPIVGAAVDIGLGYSLGLSDDGNTLAIGAPFTADGELGEVRVFEQIGGNWESRGSIIRGNETGERLGSALAISGDGQTLVVGSVGDSVSVAQVYRWTNGDWAQFGGDIFSLFSEETWNIDVDISDDGRTILVGQNVHSESMNGAAARVLRYDGFDWNQLGQALFGDPEDSALGWSVALSGDARSMVIGKPGGNVNGIDAGTVQAYAFDSQNWMPLGSELRGVGSADRQGSQVAISVDGERIAVASSGLEWGHRGASQIFDFKDGDWQQVGNTIVSDNEYTEAPTVIALAQNGEMTVVGDRDHAVDGLVQGLARTFSLRSRPILGSQIDAEPNGIASEDASSDGLDDDGVRFSFLETGNFATAEVTVSNGPGHLDAWIDFNGDGDWDDAGEQIATSLPMETGVNFLSFLIPTEAYVGDTYGRFRISSLGGLSTTGLALDGEVEDYLIPVHAPLGFDSIGDQLLSNSEAGLNVAVEGILVDPQRQASLTVSSSNPALVSALANYSFPGSEGIIELTPAPDQTGEATIDVSFVDGGADNDLQTTSDNRYFTQSFRVVVYEATITDEIEPNDSFATAQQLGPVGVQRVHGQVGIEVDRDTGARSYDLDHFDFEYLGGEALRISLEAPFSGSTRGNFDIQASLYQNQTLISSFLLDRATVSGATEFPELDAGMYSLQLVLVNNTTFVTNVSQSHPYTLTLAGDNLPAGDRYETNDSIAQAANLGVFSGRRDYSELSIHAAGNHDWFQFTTLEDGSKEHGVTIEFDDDLGDLDLALFNSDGVLLGNSAGFGDVEHISLRDQPAGTYYVQVYGFQNAVNPNYTLIVNAPLIDAIDEDAFESNDSPGEAFDLGASEGFLTIDDLTIHQPRDEDWFRFETLAEGSNADYVAIDFEHAEGDLDLRLHSATGELLKISDSVTNRERIGLAGLNAGTYYVVAYGFGDATSTAYSLSLQTPVAIAPDAWEANDLPTLASDLGLVEGTQTYANLSIHADQDVDWFEFSIGNQGGPRDLVAIEFASELGDLDILLYDVDLNLVGSSTGIEDEEVISLEGQPAGAYLVRVYGFSGATNPAYQLSIVGPAAGVAADHFETNDTLETAFDFRTLSGNIQETLSLHTSEDRDWFRVVLPERGTVEDQISIEFDHQTRNMGLWLYDAAGLPVRVSDSSASPETIRLAGLSPGEYFLEAAGVTGSATLEYSLHIDFAFSDSFADRFEANDRLSEASDLRLLTEYTRLDALSVWPAADSDYFRFEISSVGTSDHRVQIQFQHTAGDLDFELLDQAGESLAASNGTTDMETITLEGLAPGVYYVHVYGYSGATNPEYSLEIFPPNDRLSEDRFEPNDVLSQATLLRNQGDQLVGEYALRDLNLHVADDVDLFRFETLGVGTTSNFVEISAPPGSARPQLRLLDTDGVALNSGTRISLADLTAGTYYLESSLAAGQPSEYSLRINAPTDTPALDPWTIFVYITASDLDRAAHDDINEMEFALSELPAGVNVGVFWDQSDLRTTFATGGGSQAPWGTVGYAMLQADRDMSSVATEFIIGAEANSGDPATLVDFLTWGVDVAPAENYGLILWNHGDGIRGSNFDDSDFATIGGRENLRIPELASALRSPAVPAIDVLAFDACLMGTIEVAASLRDVSEVFVAAQELVGFDGHDYTTLFDVLRVNPGRVTSEELATGFVRSFEDQYAGDYSGWDTQSAISSAAVSSLLSSLEAFVTLGLGTSGTQLRYLREAANAALSYYDPESRDLGSLFSIIASTEGLSASLKSAAEDVLAALRSSVVALSQDARNSSGISIHLPDGGTADIAYRTEFSAFLAATGWSDFTEHLGGRSSGGPAGRLGRMATSQDWAEANDSPALAFDLREIRGAGNTITELSLHTGTDVDWFRFQLETATTANEQIALQAARGDILSLTLFDQTGSELLAQAMGDGNVVLALSDLDAGEYLVRVDSPGLQPVTRYDLLIDAPEIVDTSSWAGDNTSLEKAFPLGLTPTRAWFSGLAIDTSSEAWFKLETPRLANNSFYELTVFPNTPGIISASVVDRMGQTVSSTGEGGALVLGLLASGAAEEYYLKIENVSDQSAASYSLQIESATNALFPVQHPERIAGGLLAELPISELVDEVGVLSVLDSQFEIVDNTLRLRAGESLSLTAGQQRWVSIEYSDAGSPAIINQLTVPIQIEANPFAYHNSDSVYDVNGDGDVLPIDALAVINDLNKNGTRSLDIRDASAGTAVRFLDVNADNRVTPLDALAVINFLNRNRGGEPEGEGTQLFDFSRSDSAASSLQPSDVDTLLANWEFAPQTFEDLDRWKKSMRGID